MQDFNPSGRTLTQAVKDDIQVVKDDVKLIPGIATDIAKVLVEVDKMTGDKTGMAARMNESYVISF